MKHFLLFIFILLFSILNCQKIAISNIQLSIPKNYRIADQKLLDEAKSKIVGDKNYSEIIEKFDISEFNSPKTYFYKNVTCNCIDTFQIMTADYNFSNVNSDFIPNSQAAENLEYLYNETTKENVKKLNELNKNANVTIAPKISQNLNSVNILYYQIEYELIKPSNNKLTRYISDNYIIPNKEGFIITFFNFEKINYKNAHKITSEYFESIKIK